MFIGILITLLIQLSFILNKDLIIVSNVIKIKQEKLELALNDYIEDKISLG